MRSLSCSNSHLGGRAAPPALTQLPELLVNVSIGHLLVSVGNLPIPVHEYSIMTQSKSSSRMSTSRWALAPQVFVVCLATGLGSSGKVRVTVALACGSVPAQTGRLGRGCEEGALSVGALAAWRLWSGQSVALLVSHTSGRFLVIPRPTSHSTGRRCSGFGSSAAPRPGAGEFKR